MKKIVFGLFTLVSLISCSSSDSNDSNETPSSLYYWKSSIEYDNSGYVDGVLQNQILNIYPDWKSQLPSEMNGDALFDNGPIGAQLFFNIGNLESSVNLSFHLEEGQTFDVGTYHFTRDGYLQGNGYCKLIIYPSTLGSYSTQYGNDVVLTIDKISNTPTPFGQVTGSFSGTLLANSIFTRIATISGDFSAGGNNL